jgi:deoxyribodipyrimidine photolyase-related protein
MKYYYDYLLNSGFECKYINYHSSFKIKNYILFDPIDNIELPNNFSILESPNFLLNKDLYDTYHTKTDKFLFTNFYMWSKKQLSIIPNVVSQDKLNRQTLKNKHNVLSKIPKLPSNKKDTKYINDAKKYINKHFNKNYGNLDNFIFPISHNTAKKFLKEFIKNKLNNYGPYQDAIIKDEQYLFHSLLSSSINIGLINPDYIIKEVLKVKAPLNSVEGFIRQLFWREYQRYCYIYCDFNKNYFSNKKKLSNDWYDGTTNILPVDVCIKNAFQNGYLHHIERLMIIGNYMNLCQIHPKEGYRWFMEFSCDSYDWVMEQNVLDMVFFVTGGKTMRRPYTTSSNYILKMSNYKKDKWSEIWNDKYYKFIKRNKKQLYKFRYYYNVNISK